jgi:hypothetical protein
LGDRKWETQVRAWLEKRRAHELADACVIFFERSFHAPLALYPKDAWFGVHANCISLTIGNIWLAAVASPPRCAYLIVEPQLDVPGTGHLPIKATARYVPLDFLTAKPWERVRWVNGEERIWESYGRACESILQSPISKNVITRNLHRKARLKEFYKVPPSERDA